MSNQWKMVPVEVSAQGVKFGNAWYSHERITGYSAEQLNEGNCCVTGKQYMKWLASSPVPPAGDVETAAWLDLEKVSHGMAYATRMKTNHRQTELVDRAHVTRLTAERDGLILKLETMTADRDAEKAMKATARDQRDRVTSELSKARELLGGMLFAFDDGVGQDWSAPLLDEARKFCPAIEFKSAHNADESCGQDAEAEKGGA